MPAEPLEVEAISSRSEIQLALHDIKNTLKNQDDKQAAMDTKIDSLVYDIRGNGTPGLKERMNTLEREIGFFKRIGWAALGFIGTASVSVMGVMGMAVWKLIAR